MRFYLSILSLIVFSLYLNAQPNYYSNSNAHSHNDYEQNQPFYKAYEEGYGSIEADIHWVAGKILVAHDAKNLSTEKTLENLYLNPLNDLVTKYSGYPYGDTSKNLQILIDQKTEAKSTLAALIILLKKYPLLINNKKIKFSISGERPASNEYINYPNFIHFDGRLGETYSKEALTKISLLSADFGDFVKKRFPLVISSDENEKIKSVIKSAHLLHKPVRFWGTADEAKTWEQMLLFGVDFINTDHIQGLSDFLLSKNEATHLMPFNRIIRSAGTVIRFGNPKLENHALDISSLDNQGLIVAEDRYGIIAIDVLKNTIVDRWTYKNQSNYQSYISVYSGIKTIQIAEKKYIVWTAAAPDQDKSCIMVAEWNKGFENIVFIPIDKKSPASNALPNDLIIRKEKSDYFIYVVLNGNNEIRKYDFKNHRLIWKSETGNAPYGIAYAQGNLFVTNWAGSIANDSTKEIAGIPWGSAYTNPRTGATSNGSVSVFNETTGKFVKEIKVALHPNAIIASKDEKKVFVSNGSSDEISIIQTAGLNLVQKIKVGLLHAKDTLEGSSPNALELSSDNSTLYVANGLDNAIAVVNLAKNKVIGFIPTEAYPSAAKIYQNKLVVANLESDGSNVIDVDKNARSIHQQMASISIIPIPTEKKLSVYSEEVAQLNMANRLEQMHLAARPNRMALPVPERLGEPSIFKHVVYIIKENKTYDQVFGDMPMGRNDSSLTIFGEKITPNMHALGKAFGWMDNYYASGKSSAEGHQWTDAGMVSDYVEKMVRAWFRSYPHRQEDAMVYNKNGFIWNQALDHGKTVKIYGEACETIYDKKRDWSKLYQDYQNGIQPDWHNTSTIARIRPIIHETYPDCDNINFQDQQRADLFLADWKNFETHNNLPNLMVLSLPNDHSSGTSPGFPTPNAMVADNDLSVGRIIEAISKSKYWDSTVVFITEDDSQGGWDHISSYRTIGLVISAYSKGSLVTNNYNQTSMLRTIEQILGIPPMNIIDASARLMTDCFQLKKNNKTYQAIQNNIPLNQMNSNLEKLSGKAKKLAIESKESVFKEIDGGDDEAMNRILWFYAKGDKPYPKQKSLK